MNSSFTISPYYECHEQVNLYIVIGTTAVWHCVMFEGQSRLLGISVGKNREKKQGCRLWSLFWWCTGKSQIKTLSQENHLEASYSVTVIITANITVLPTVVFHLCWRHDIQMTAAVFHHTSSGTFLLFVSTVGKQAFPVSVATVWNDLPLHVASAPSLVVFRQRLETFLFSRSYQDTIIWLVCYYHHSSLLSRHLWSLQ